MMNGFTESIWQESINNQLQMEGWSKTPVVSTLTLIMAPTTSRDEEVLVMSLFYKNNLLNSFLFSTEKRLCPSPLCSCGEEEQTAFHLLCNCRLVDTDTREQLIYHLILGNNVRSMKELEANTKFITLCKEVVTTDALKLRTKIRLTRNK